MAVCREKGGLVALCFLKSQLQLLNITVQEFSSDQVELK